MEKLVLSYCLISYSIFTSVALSQEPLVVVGGTALVAIAVLGYFIFTGPRPSIRRYSRGEIISLAFLSAVFLPFVLLPPWKVDDLLYHVHMPSYLASNWAFPVDPWNINLNFPMLFELPTVLCKYFKVPAWHAPNYIFVLVLFTYLASNITKHIDGSKRNMSYCIVVGVLTQEVFFELMASNYVELFLSLVVVMGIVQYQTFLEKSNTRNWYLSCIFLGLAGATKYIGVYFFLLVLIYEFFRKERVKRYYLGLGFGLIVALPWYLKSLILVGNPFYPYFSFAFPTENLSVERSQFVFWVLDSYTQGRSWQDYLLLPVRLIVNLSFEPRPGFYGFGGYLSVLFFLTGLGFFCKRNTQILLVMIGGFYLILWAWGSQQVRFLLPVILLMLPAALQQVLENLSRRKIRALYLILAVAFMQNIYHVSQFADANGFLGFWLGKGTSAELVNRHNKKTMAIAPWVNRHLQKPKTKLWTIGNFGRSYPYNIEVLAITHFESEPFSRAFGEGRNDFQSLGKFLKKWQVTHIQYDREYMRNFYDGDLNFNWDGLNKYLVDNFRALVEIDSVIVFERL